MQNGWFGKSEGMVGECQEFAQQVLSCALSLNQEIKSKLNN